MKILEKISLTVFSMIILMLSLILSLMLFNWLEVNYIYYFLKFLVATPIATNISLGIAIVFQFRFPAKSHLLFHFFL